MKRHLFGEEAQMEPKYVPREPRQVDLTGRVNRLYTVLSNVNEAIVRMREPQELYEAACRIAVDDGQFVLAWIGFVDPGSQYIRPIAKAGRDDGYLDSVKMSLSEGLPEGQGPTGIALREGHAFINNDTANNPIMRPWRDEQLKRGYRSSASFPLKAEGATVGVITLYASEPNYFDEEEVRLLGCLADDFSFALESAEIATQRAAATVALQQSREELEVRVAEISAAFEDLIEQRTSQANYAEALNRINDRVHSTLDFDEIMNRVVTEIADVLEVDAAVVQVHKGNYWEFEYSHGLPEELRFARLPDAEVPLSMQVLRTLAPVVVDDVARDDRVNANTMKKFGITALMAVPLIVRAEVFGVLLADRFGKPAPFAPQQLDFLEKAATTLALGLENSRLLESMQETARLSDALNVVNASVHSTLELDEVMQRALEAGVEVLACDAGTIEMYERDEWIVRYQTGFSAQDVGIHLGADQTPNAARAARELTTIAINDMAGNEKLEVGFVKRYGLRSVLAVPLVAKTVVIGCALFYTSTRARHFTDAEIDFGQKLGSVVSLSLENARLYGAERGIAETLQKALLSLPDTVSGIEFAPFYQSATESTLVGGDFYDIFELDDRRIGITIGDISGKGLDAAVLTSLVRNTIRAHANVGEKTPAHVLTLTNNIVTKSTPTEAFATVFFGILDREDGRLVYASAGHTTSAIVRQDGTLTRLGATSPILGAFADLEFAQCDACLERGEILFLYTDGLTEARCDRELYGEGRLFAGLISANHTSARSVAENAVTNVVSFAGNHLRDDLAILAVRRLESSSETTPQG